MRLAPFVVFTFLGSLPWTAALVVAGYALGENWETIGAWLKRFEYLIIGALILAAILFVWWRLGHPGWNRRAAATEDRG
jgi:membrane protein DedA with SNARE-associated domain